MGVNGFVHETGRLITDRIGVGRHFSLLPVTQQWKDAHLKTSYLLIQTAVFRLLGNTYGGLIQYT
jgi:hypothetical protein